MASAQYDPLHDRLPSYLGYAAVVASFGGVVLAMFAAPWFSPLFDALSDLGARGAVTAPLFNGALLVGGALGLGFVAALVLELDTPVRAAGALFGGFAMLFMALVGAFPIPDPLHGVVAVPFFVCLTLALFLWGGGDYAAGRPLRGLVFVLLAVAHAVAWAWWALFPWFPPGIALPELVGSTGFALWGGWVARDRLAAVEADRDRL
jgi:hypothetical membrane protein